MMFMRTNPRRTSKTSRECLTNGDNNKVPVLAQAAAGHVRNSSTGAVSSRTNKTSISLPPNVKRSCSDSSSVSLSSTSSALSTQTGPPPHKRMPSRSTHKRTAMTPKRLGSQCTDGQTKQLTTLRKHSGSPSAHSSTASLSLSPGSSITSHNSCTSSNHSYDGNSDIQSSWQRHQYSNATFAAKHHSQWITDGHTPVPHSDNGRTIARLELEVYKLTLALKRHRKYTPEWFVIDTKLGAAKEELEAVMEDRDLDFLDGATVPIGTSASGNIEGGSVNQAPGVEILREGMSKDGECDARDGILGIPDTVTLVSGDDKRQEESLNRLLIDILENQMTMKQNNNKIQQVPSQLVEQQQRYVGNYDKVAECGAAIQREYQMRLQKLKLVPKFTDEWFQLQEEIIELRHTVLFDAEHDSEASSFTVRETYPLSPDNRKFPILTDDLTYTTGTSSYTSKGDENFLSVPSLDNDDISVQENIEERSDSQCYPSMMSFNTTLSECHPIKDSSPRNDFNPRPYHEKLSTPPSCLPFSSPSFQLSPPRLLHYSPPSSPLFSRELFPSSNSISSSYYSQANNDSDDDLEEDEKEANHTKITSDSQDPETRNRKEKLKSDYAEACSELDTLAKFSKEWFDLKTKTVLLEDQLEAMENASHAGETRSVSGWSHFSSISGVGGGTTERSASAWSEEDDEIMSFACDLELVMVGEALKQGYCISPMKNDEDDDFFIENNNKYREPLSFDDHDLLLVSTEDCVKRNAASVIQTNWMRYQQFRFCMLIKSSAVKIQSLIRGTQQLERYRKQRKRLIILQSFVRKFQASSKCKRILLSILQIQKFWRREIRSREMCMKALQSVTIIQSSLRRWLSQSSYTCKRRNAIRIQSSWKAQRQCTKFQQLRSTIISIQSYFRRRIQMHFYLQLLSNTVKIQSFTRHWLLRKSTAIGRLKYPHITDQSHNSMHSLLVRREHVAPVPSNEITSRHTVPSDKFIQKQHLTLLSRLSQVPKYSSEWFDTMEQIQDLKGEHLSQGSTNLHYAHGQDHCITDKVQESPKTEEDSSRGHVMRMVQSIEAKAKNTRFSPITQPTVHDCFRFSPQNAMPQSSESTPQKKLKNDSSLKHVAKNCARLSHLVESLPKYSPEWFQSKIELKTATETLEFLYLVSLESNSSLKGE